MSGFRVLFGVISAISGVFLSLSGALYLIVGLPFLIPETVKHGRIINQAFSVAATWVDTFSQAKARLPESQEFANWAASQPDPGSWLKGMYFISSPDSFPEELIKVFGQPPANGYALEIWRGEWSEYFASWTHTSSIGSASGLYVSTMVEGLVLIVLGFLFWFVSRKCLPTRRYSGVGPRNDS